MKKDMVAREMTMEIVVGAFLFMILLGLGYFTILLGSDNLFRPLHRLEVIFEDVAGLRKGDNVVVRGMPVGQVEKVELLQDSALATLALRQEVPIREGYQIRIVPTSLLGGNYLMIDQGLSDAQELPKDLRLQGEVPKDLVAEATRLVTGMRKSLEEGRLVENLSATVEEARAVMTKISAGEGTLGQLVNSRALYDELSGVSSNLAVVAADLAAGKGTVGRLLREDAVYEDLQKTLASIREISGRLERGEGSLGRILTEDGLYSNIDAVVSEARAALDDIRETSPIVTFTSILFGAF